MKGLSFSSSFNLHKGYVCFFLYPSIFMKGLSVFFFIPLSSWRFYFSFSSSLYLHEGSICIFLYPSIFMKGLSVFFFIPLSSWRVYLYFSLCLYLHEGSISRPISLGSAFLTVFYLMLCPETVKIITRTGGGKCLKKWNWQDNENSVFFTITSNVKS